MALLTGNRFDLRAAIALLLGVQIIAVFYFQSIAVAHTTLTDDYYYYERIARNLVAGNGSTYDGVVRTNGYHPLWMAFVAIAVVVEKVSGIKAQIGSLAICACLSIGILTILCLNVQRLTPFLAAAILTLAAYCIFFGVMGMETSLELFLGTLFFLRTGASAFRVDAYSGILLALCFLARIDSLIYFFPLVLYLWWITPVRKKLQFAAPVFLTILIYCWSNQLLFDTALPISGAAKAVRHIKYLHSETWVDLLLTGRQSQLMLLATTLLTAWSALEVSREMRRYVFLSVLGVLLFYVVISLHSDWNILEWYLYPIALHLIFVSTVARTSKPIRSFGLLKATAVACAVGSLVLVGFRNSRMAEHQGALVEAAQRLQRLFANEPDATIAMGDRAGAVGQALPNRLIQLEGLVMDSDYLTGLRHSGSIMEILKRYNVHYYIATTSSRNDDGCYTTWEPSQSRGDSFKLQSRVCAPVVATFTLDGYTTVVFDVSKS